MPLKNWKFTKYILYIYIVRNKWKPATVAVSAQWSLCPSFQIPSLVETVAQFCTLLKWNLELQIHYSVSESVDCSLAVVPTEHVQGTPKEKPQLPVSVNTAHDTMTWN